MSQNSSNKTIAQNTLFLYFRMALTILIGLYTSRVILQTLGVEDFGIYNIAGSVVALFGFLNGALAQSSSRYITIELGKLESNGIQHLKNCFTTTRAIHAILAGIILIICETIGLWILCNRCEIPTERLSAAIWTFQFSTLTAILSVTQAPFTALIIAHEQMKIYAYAGIIEVCLKLIICYCLLISPIDMLVFYALLLFLLQTFIMFFYKFYCKHNFQECSFKYTLDKRFFHPILNFSGWNLLGSLSYAALTQGATIIISLFFGPAIVAARAIAGQVKMQIMNFINNFRTAINPQILKRFSSGDIKSSKKLLFLSTNISFYLMLLIVLPLFFCTDFILKLWLKQVPPYTTEFLQITLIEILFVVYDISFYMIFQATGRLKENAIICPITDLIVLGIIYFIYHQGGNVLWIAWGMLFLTILQGGIIKPWLAIKLFNYQWNDFINIFYKNTLVLISSAILPSILYLKDEKTTIDQIYIMFLSCISVVIFSFLLGFSKQEKQNIKSLILSKIISKK